MKIKMELLTPAFTRGALSPEFRISAIRGLMRWWFRAVAHAVVKSRGSRGPVKDVWRLETSLFGSTKNRGLFSLQMLSAPQRHSFVRRGGSAWRYLALGISERDSFFIGDFEIGLRFLSTASIEQKSALVATLGIMGALGSIGRRSRRGFGSLCIKEVEGDGFDELTDLMISSPFNGKKIRSLLEVLEESLEELVPSEDRTAEERGPPEFPLLSSRNLRIKLGTAYPDCTKALNNIAFVLRRYREVNELSTARIRGKIIEYRVTRQYGEVRKIIDAAKRKAPSVDARLPLSAFGLPHQYYFRSTGEKVIIEGEIHRRRASPVMFKVVRLNEGYAPLVLLVESSFLPRNERLCAEVKSLNEKVLIERTPDLSEVRRFFDELGSSLDGGKWRAL